MLQFGFDQKEETIHKYCFVLRLPGQELRKVIWLVSGYAAYEVSSSSLEARILQSSINIKLL